MSNEIKFKGVIDIERYENGILDAKFHFENLVTDAGFDYLRRYLGGDNSTPINNIAMGDDNTAPNVSDIILKHKLITVTVRRDYSIDKQVKFLATIPENSFPTTVYYKEGGLIAKIGVIENLITRSVFTDVVYQKPENSLSIAYSLQLL